MTDGVEDAGIGMGARDHTPLRPRDHGQGSEPPNSRRVCVWDNGSPALVRRMETFGIG